jgi:hypothetical protein
MEIRAVILTVGDHETHANTMTSEKDLQSDVFRAADDLLAQGVTPTLGRIARAVGGERHAVQRALENWAAGLANAAPEPEASGRRERTNAIAADTLQEVARALTPHTRAPGEEEYSDDHPIVGSLPELEAELTRQTRTLERLRQREQEQLTVLANTQRQIRGAENRARLLAESIANGGKLLDQATLRRSRTEAKDAGEK